MKSPSLRFVAVRLASLLVSLALASVIVFVVLRLLPGDSAGTSLGVGTTTDQLESLRAELGTDRPLHVQYLDWLGGFFTGQTTSFVSRLTFGELVAPKLAITLPLSLLAFALSVVISVPAGVVAAMRRDSFFGVAISSLAQLGIAVPIFWLGVILIWVFALEARVLPAGGFPRQGWDQPWDALRSLLLPAVAIAIAMTSVIVRYIRSAVIDVLDADYMRTARSLGYSRWQAFVRHGLRNAAAPVIAILAIELATSLLGAVVVENVFALPGLGTLLLSSVTSRDLPIVQNLVLLLTAVVLVTNFAVDLVQRAIDPRLRLADASRRGAR